MRHCRACNSNIPMLDKLIDLLAELPTGVLPAEPQAEPYTEPQAAAKT